MTYRMITTCIATLVFAGGFLAAGCGGGDSSPTRPAEPTTPAPTPPPAPTVSRIEVSPTSASLEVGRTRQFTATAKASDGATVGGVNISWASSNTAVVTIGNTGVATAVAAGTATIRATGNGISSAPVTITVTQAPVARVTVSPSSTQELMIGEMVTFTATARTSGGAVRGDVSFTWTSSDTAVVTITSAGVATAVGAGTASIRATAGGIASSPVTINVAEPPPPEPVVSTVTVTPASMMMMVGGTFQFTAVATTADGMVIDDVEFTWMSDDAEVATVDVTGLVTAVAAGTAMITATGNDVTSMPATVTVEEAAPVVATVEIVDAMPVMLQTGETHQLMAVARTTDGTMVGGVTFAWSSDDNEVATVDSTGLVTAVGAGMADVTAMTEDTTSEPVTVTVADPPPVVDRVTVEPMTASIEEGETEQFTATAYDSDDVEITGKTFTWKTGSTTVATIDSTGLATGVGEGSTTITATVDSVSGMATLTVTAPPVPEPEPEPDPPPPPPPPEPMVATVTVSPSSASIEEGQTRRFTARAYDSDNMVITGKTFRWESTNTAVATINTAGLATARIAGSTTIRATVDGVSGTASLTVTEPPPVVDRVTVSPTSPSIEEGKTQRFTAAAYDSDNTVISGKTFRWTSSNTSVATVSPSSGTSTTATAVEAGSTTITASVDGESGTAMLTVTAPPPPPMLRSRTATISGRGSYQSTAGSVTFEEVAGGKLKLTITGMNDGGGVRAHLFLYTSSTINWTSGAVPDGARHFGDVTNQGSFTKTFEPDSGETIDSYSHVILHCALVNMPLGSGSF